MEPRVRETLAYCARKTPQEAILTRLLPVRVDAVQVSAGAHVALSAGLRAGCVCSDLMHAVVPVAHHASSQAAARYGAGSR